MLAVAQSTHRKTRVYDVNGNREPRFRRITDRSRDGSVHEVSENGPTASLQQRETLFACSGFSGERGR
jgi:hypothetical protein